MEITLKSYNEIINEFVKDCKELLLILKLFKKQIKMIVPLKEQELGFYKTFVEFTCKYEDINTKNVRALGEQHVADLNI